MSSWETPHSCKFASEQLIESEEETASTRSICQTIKISKLEASKVAHVHSSCYPDHSPKNNTIPHVVTAHPTGSFQLSAALHVQLKADLLLQKWLDPAQDHKGKWLYIWAKEAGLTASRDELAEMLATNSLTPPLAELWTQKTTEQKAIGRLCQAAAAGDLEDLKVPSIPSLYTSREPIENLSCPLLHLIVRLAGPRHDQVTFKSAAAEVGIHLLYGLHPPSGWNKTCSYSCMAALR